MRAIYICVLSMIVFTGCATTRTPGSSPQPEPTPLSIQFDKDVGWELGAIAGNTKCYTDREYIPLILPDGTGGGKLLRRRKNEDKHWLPPNVVYVSKECELIVAILTSVHGKHEFDDTDHWNLVNSGWQKNPDKFKCNMSSDEEWILYQKYIPAGYINMGDTSKLPHTALIFMFTESSNLFDGSLL